MEFLQQFQTIAIRKREENEDVTVYYFRIPTHVEKCI
jgi:hypothetical protein